MALEVKLEEDKALLLSYDHLAITHYVWKGDFRVERCHADAPE